MLAESEMPTPVPQISMVLSGMSNLEQLQASIAIWDEDKPLAQEEWDAILAIGDTMATGVPCTACHYCTNHCPMELDIPHLISLYNEHKFTGGGFIAPMALGALPADKQPSACIGCGSCAAVCPQQSGKGRCEVGNAVEHKAVEELLGQDDVYGNVVGSGFAHRMGNLPVEHHAFAFAQR